MKKTILLLVVTAVLFSCKQGSKLKPGINDIETLKSVKNVENDSIQTSWISSGSFRYPYESLKISEDYSVVMTIPEVKKFSSDIDILTKEGKRINTVLEVNKPYKYKGWKI